MSGGSISFDEIESREGFLATGDKPTEIDWLPDPPRQPRHVTLISVDDHLVEPPDMFEGRVPAKYADAAPRVMTEDGGATEYWLYDGQQHYKVGLNAVVGKPLHQRTFDPARFDEMRRGAYDIHARVHDMDLNGVYASLCFPSSLAGFAGQRYQLGVSDPELARAVVRAANDWQLDVWAGTYPGRIIPLQLPWLLDPEEGASEIRANAARSFHAVTFPELPERLGLPSLHTGHWDPLMEACEDTGTVVCLHVGSSSSSPSTAPDAPPDTIGVLFFGYAMFAAVDWLYSRIPVRFPDLRICLSEGGIGWVAGLLDRLEHVRKYDAMYGTWNDVELSPADTFRRNFWVCAIDDPSAFLQRDVIGIENILVESDYPHADSTWPHTQERLAAQLAGLSDREAAKVTWQNAADLFRHPVPVEVQRDPNAF